MGSLDQIVEIDYTNWRGERAKRRIVPMRISWENSEWHPETQWILEALDVEKKEMRSFAFASIHSWAPVKFIAAVAASDPQDDAISALKNWNG